MVCRWRVQINGFPWGTNSLKSSSILKRFGLLISSKVSTTVKDANADGWILLSVKLASVTL
jgi:hypothetical protein